jgi:hypothetical protein
VQPGPQLPTLTSVLSFAFAIVMVLRYAGRRRPYYAVWAVGLAFFGLGSAAEAWGSASGWTVGLYRWWYLSGAICVAAYLGAGSLYLNSSRVVHWLTVGFVASGCLPALASGYLMETFLGLTAAALLAALQVRAANWFASAALGLLVLGTVLAGVRVLAAEVTTALLPQPHEIATGQAFPEGVRLLTPMFNIPGALLLLTGAAVSAVRWREAPARVASNALIALGAFVPSLASSLMRFGDSEQFYVGQLVGVLCLLGGFAVSDLTSAQPRLRPSVSGGPS